MILRNQERFGAEWWQLDPTLRLILCDADLWCFERSEPFIITCLYRTEEEQRLLVDSGASKSMASPHCYWRGADAHRFEDDELAKDFMAYINGRYPYDPTRPKLQTLIEHMGTGIHFHFQCLETRRFGA